MSPLQPHQAESRAKTFSPSHCASGCNAGRSKWRAARSSLPLSLLLLYRLFPSQPGQQVKKKKGPGGSVAPAELLCCAKPWNSNSASFFSGPALSDSVMSGRNYTALRNTAPVKFSSCYYTFLSLDGILNEELHQSVRC